MALDYYSYSDAETMTQVFNAIAALTASSDYLDLIKVVLLIGGLVAVMTTISTNRFIGANWFIVAVLVYLGLLVPKVDVIINDRTGIQSPAVVSNVPIGSAFFGAVTSKIGDYLTTSAEATFSLPSDMRYSENGMLFGHRVIQQLRETNIRDKTLKDDLHSFMENCAWYDMNTYYFYTIDELITSTDPMVELKNTNTVLYTTVAGNLRLCSVAITEIEASVIAHANTHKTLLSQILNPSDSTANALIKLESQLPSVYNQMTQSALAATDIIRTNMLFNMLKENDAKAAASANDPSAVAIALATAQAEQTQLSTYRTMSNVAEGALPKIRTVIEAIIMASFPFVLPIMIMAGHAVGPLLKAYVTTLFWIQLWPPLYAVANLVQTANSSKNIYAITRVDGAMSTNNSFDVYLQTLSDADIAGYMVLSIPIIAYAIIKGGEMAFVSLASSLMQPAASAASQAGSAAATGNWSLGNMSVENMRGFQTQMAPATAGMGVQSRVDGWGNEHTHAVGTGASAVSQMQNSTMFGSSVKSAVSSETREMASEFQTASQSWREQSSMQTSAAFGHAISSSDDKTAMQSSGQGWSAEQEASNREAIRQIDTAGSQLDGQLGLQRGEGARLIAQGMVHGSVGVEVLGNGGGIRAEGGLQKDFSSSMTSAVMEKVTSMSNTSRDSMQAMSSEYSSNETYRDEVNSSQRDTAQIDSSLKQADQYSQMAEQQMQLGLRMEEMHSKVEGETGQSMIEFAKGHMMTGTIVSAMDAYNNGEVVRAQQIINTATSDIVEKYTDINSSGSGITPDQIKHFSQSNSDVGNAGDVRASSTSNDSALRASGHDTSAVNDEHNVKSSVESGHSTTQSRVDDGSQSIEQAATAQRDMASKNMGTDGPLKHGDTPDEVQSVSHVVNAVGTAGASGGAVLQNAAELGNKAEDKMKDLLGIEEEPPGPEEK